MELASHLEKVCACIWEEKMRKREESEKTLRILKLVNERKKISQFVYEKNIEGNIIKETGKTRKD